MLMQQPEMPDKLKLQIISATEVLGRLYSLFPSGMPAVESMHLWNSLKHIRNTFQLFIAERAYGGN